MLLALSLLTFSTNRALDDLAGLLAVAKVVSGVGGGTGGAAKVFLYVFALDFIVAFSYFGASRRYYSNFDTFVRELLTIWALASFVSFIKLAFAL